MPVVAPYENGAAATVWPSDHTPLTNKYKCKFPDASPSHSAVEFWKNREMGAVAAVNCATPAGALADASRLLPLQDITPADGVVDEPWCEYSVVAFCSASAP